MRIKKIPLFLMNGAWYNYDNELHKYTLTDEGLNNKEVLESYNDFYELLDEGEVELY